MNSNIEKTENRGGQPQRPDWWVAVPSNERDVIRAVMGMVRGLKQSKVPQVARAAAKWESGIGCFIKVRLENQKRKV